MSLTAKKIIDLLGLEPLEPEGGYFRELWRSTLEAAPEILGAAYDTPRSLGTAIYYLLTPDTVSAMHRLPSDEIFHFYLGDPVQMLQLSPGGKGRTVELGTDLEAGQRPLIVVPGGIWQGAHLIDGGSFALLGTTVAPGFDYRDYTHGKRELLCSGWPDYSDLITSLTTDAS